jgi:hypothetical protein
MNKEIEKAIESLKNNRYFDEGVKDLAITALEAQQADAWIPVSSGLLPECDDDVRVTYKTYDPWENKYEYQVGIGYRRRNFPDEWMLTGRGANVINVIAWKPIDEPWKEDYEER